VTSEQGAADSSALAALDFPEVIGRIAEFATCAPGRAAVLELRPLAERADAAAGQAQVDEAVAHLHSGGDLSFAGVQDVGATIDRAALGATLSAEELLRISHGEASLARVSLAVRNSAAGAAGARPSPSPLLELAAQARDTGPLVRTIDGAIERDGSIRDDASAELGKIRRRQKSLRDEVRERCAAIVRNQATARQLSEPVVTVRAGRFVVPVRKEFVTQFGGVVHDESASGATAFVEPLACVDANNRLRRLEASEAREIARILGGFSDRVRTQADDLRQNAVLRTRLDSVGARGRWARHVEANAPDLADDSIIRIVRGRHPLLRHAAVPLDVTLGEEFDVLIVSGPNMGGKSVALKTIGLFCALAFAAIPLPAAPGTRIGRFDRLVCVLGDEQSIAADLSSFSGHLRALQKAMELAGPRSLILVDEIGSGTEPGAGAAIAQSFLETVMTCGAKVVATTHFTQLKVFAAETSRVANGSMLFDARTNQPTYALAVGIPGESLALRLARSLAMDLGMIERAESLLGDDAKNLERAFQGLAAERDRMLRRQMELGEELARATKLEASLNERISELERERRSFETRARAELDAAVRAVREELLERAGRSAAAAKRQSRLPGAEETLAKALADIRRSLGLERPQPSVHANPSVVEGDAVFVRSFGQTGTVSAVYDRDLLVTMGAVRAVVPKADVVLDAAADLKRSSQDQSRATAAAAETVRTEIDVRGMRVDEATPVLDKALDEAWLAGLTELRVIHGKGTGQLSRGLNAFLRDHAQVKSTRTAHEQAGGSGVTLVTLKE